MSGEEPRRSIRSNKGQHKNASSSPPPNPKPTKTTKAKPRKQSTEPVKEEDDDDEEDDEQIRCICGNDDRNDKRAFIACDSCSVWQHNICLGIPEDEDETPEHYYCEQCVPEDHQETLQALKRGEKIWETRMKIYQSEKKMSKNRKSKSKPTEETTPGWLRKPVPPENGDTAEPAQPEEHAKAVSAEAASADEESESRPKRKRDDVKDEQIHEDTTAAEETATRPSRLDKRRKSSAPEGKADADPETALVAMEQLPADRKKVANALSLIISNDITERVKKAAYKLPDGQSSKALGEHYGVRIEYSLHMNHGGTKEAGYTTQFRALNANLKKNRALIERLLQNSLTSDDLSTMSTSDMASEELQRERAELKEVLDRQAIAVSEEGPRFRQDHKGYHPIEDEGKSGPDNRAPTPQPPPASADAAIARPQSQSEEPRGDAMDMDDTSAMPGTGSAEQLPPGQQFDMKNIWAKTAQSPATGSAPNGGVQHVRRTSSIPTAPAQQNSAQHDPDIDRMLQDDDDVDDEDYVPTAATSEDAIVWHGKLVQNNEEDAPVLNARFVAGRDLAPTVAWQDLLPAALSIDGRLQISKAEDYLCGLRYSTSTDVSVLALTPHDNVEAFNKVFEYFHSRGRYAVIEKGKPVMVKDFYIMPVEIGAELPEHIQMLEHCVIKQPVEERLLLATLAVVRAPENVDAEADANATPSQQRGSSGSIPSHVRVSMSGPAGSPIGNSQTPFSPPGQEQQPPLPQAGYGSFPPNPYSSTPPTLTTPQPHLAMRPDSRIDAILGDLQFTKVAQAILQEGHVLADQQLVGLRKLLLENPQARDDIGLVEQMLKAQGRVS